MKKFNVEHINLYTVITDILNNIVTIILSATVAFVGCFVFLTYIVPREYTSSMIISVNLSGYTSQSTSLSLARTVSIAEKLDDVFESDAMIRVVENELGESVKGAVSARQFVDTNLIEVTVVDNSPINAFKITQAIANNYHKVTDYSFTNIIIKIVASPEMPSGPSNSSFILKASILVALAAAVLSTAAIFLMSYMRDTVKNVSDVESELNGRLFGTVYHLKKLNAKLPVSKRRLILSNPFVGYRFTESFRKMAIKIESLNRTKGIKTVMVTSTAENEGKTTVSVNIAVALARNEHRVLLIDCDFKKPAVKYFFSDIDHSVEKDFHKFLQEGGDINNYVKFDTATGLYILDSWESCINSAERLSGPRFSETVNALKQQFDYIIIDTPPSGIIVDAEIIADVADASLIVVRQDFVNVANINDQIEAIDKHYFAGCIFNNVHEFKALSNTASDETSRIYQSTQY